MAKSHLWTPEEEDELIEIVEEQSLTILNFPELAWERISVQTGKTPEQCKRHWEWMGTRKGNPAVSPFYLDGEEGIGIL